MDGCKHAHGHAFLWLHPHDDRLLLLSVLFFVQMILLYWRSCIALLNSVSGVEDAMNSVCPTYICHCLKASCVILQVQQ